MDTVPILLGLAFIILKVMSTAKNVAGGAVVAAVTQLLTWVAGVLVVLVASNVDATEAYVLAGTAQTLGDLDAWGTIFLGVMAGSLASVIYDFKKAFDSTDSAAEPALFHVAQHRDVT